MREAPTVSSRGGDDAACNFSMSRLVFMNEGVDTRGAESRAPWTARTSAPAREGNVKRIAKLLTGAAAGFGLLALVFAGRGDSEDEGDRAEARAPSVSQDQITSVRTPSGPEGPGLMDEELDGTDLFVG